MTRPSRWFPGYTVAGISGLAFFATAPGQTFIISQLNTPLREAFDIGELTLNTAYAVATIAAAFPLVIVGRLTDRFGPRKAMAMIALFYGAACLFMAGVGGAVTVFVAFFLLRFLGQGALALVSQHAIAMWFHRRLGSIHGLLQVGVFAAWILFPQMAVRLIDMVGWRQTYIIFAVAIWLLIPIVLLFLRNRPEDIGLRMDGDPPEAAAVDPPAIGTGGVGEAVTKGVGSAPLSGLGPPVAEAVFTLKHASRTRAYWTLAAAFFLSPLIGTAFLFDIQPLLLSRGMTLDHAANAVSAWSATMCLMALPSGLLTDRVRPSLLVAGGMFLIGLSSLILMLAYTPLGAAGALVCFGVGQSIIATTGSTSLARFFGRTHHGAIRSSTMRIGVIGTGMGTIFTGVSVRLTGDYNAAMIVFILMCVPVAVLAASLRRPRHPEAPALASDTSEGI